MTLDEMLAVLQAAKAGKVIETRFRGPAEVWCRTNSPDWNFEEYEYRVALDAFEEWWRGLECVDGHGNIRLVSRANHVACIQKAAARYIWDAALASHPT